MYFNGYLYGFTALHCSSKGGHASVCRLLIDEKADVNAMEKRY
jgi:hypothetical protein